MKKLLLVMVVFLMAGVASAGDNNWTPTDLDPNFPGAGVANWDVGANWSLTSLPTSTQKISFSVIAAECIVNTTDAITNQFVTGDNGPQTTHRLTIMDGGILNTCATGSSWSSVGYNRATVATVERGGAWIAGNRLGVGLVGGAAGFPVTSVLNIDGGTVDMDGNLQLGAPATGRDHTGILNVKSGTVDIAGTISFRGTVYVAGPPIVVTGTDIALIDIHRGTVIFSGEDVIILEISGSPDVVAPVADLIASGDIIAYGGVGTIVNDYDVATDVTTLTAIGDPRGYSPYMDEVVEMGPITLGWINIGTPPVWVDVLFGTSTSTWTKVVNGTQDATSVGISADPAGPRVWRVDTYLDDPAGVDPNTVEGVEMHFFASDDQEPTVIIDTVPTATWKDWPTPINAHVLDDGKSEVTVTWTADDPNVGFTPPTNTIPIQATYMAEPGIAVTTSMKCNYNAGTVIVTATVTDANPMGYIGEDDVSVYVAETACAAARDADGMDRAVIYIADINEDCRHDNLDFQLIGAEWLDPSYAITDPQPL